MLSTEKRCRKWMLGTIDYSPEVMMRKFKREMWRLIEKNLQGGRVYSRYIRRRAEHCGIESPLSSSIDNAKRGYRICKETFKSLKQDSLYYRKRHLRARVREAKANGDIERSKRIKAVIQCEEQVRDWRMINNTWEKWYGRSVTKVTVVNDNDEV